MVIYHYLVQEVFGGERYHRFDPYVVGREIADLWLEGTLAKSSFRKDVNGKERVKVIHSRRVKAKHATESRALLAAAARAGQTGSHQGSTD
jgi:hypothetical protein